MREATPKLQRRWENLDVGQYGRAGSREAIVGAIARPNGEVVVPRGEAMIQVGDRVIFFTLESIVPELESAFLVEPRKEYA